MAILSGCGASTGRALADVERTSATVADARRGDALVNGSAVPGGVTDAEARCIVAELDAEADPATTDDLLDVVSAIDDPRGWRDADPAVLAERDHLLRVAGSCMTEGRVISRLMISAVQGGFTTDEARCYATRRIDTRGKADALRTEFTLPRDATLVREVIDVFVLCGDIRRVFSAGLVTQGLSRAEADCVAHAVRDDDLRALLASGLTDDDATGALAAARPRVAAVLTTCGVHRSGTA